MPLFTQIPMRFILFFLLLSVYGYSQSGLTDLKFETDYINAVDEWVAFPKVGEKSLYDYGFIFLDVHSGFSYKYESKFTIEGGNFAKIEKDTTVGFVKFVLDKNTKKVSVLNKAQIKALDLPDVPNWLKAYKKGQDKVKYLVKKGFYFNAAGASELALPSLLEAYKEDPHYQGLEYELGFAYNAVGDFKSAVKVLEKAIDNNPLNIAFYKELGYSYENLGNTQEAEKMYKLGINLSNDNSFKMSLALRMVQYFYSLKNEPKFKEWSDMMLRFSGNDPKYQQFINNLINEWNSN